MTRRPVTNWNNKINNNSKIDELDNSKTDKIDSNEMDEVESFQVTPRQRDFAQDKAKPRDPFYPSTSGLASTSWKDRWLWIWASKCPTSKTYLVLLIVDNDASICRSNQPPGKYFVEQDAWSTK